MKLATINKILRWTGFRLVVEADFAKKTRKPYNPTELYLDFWGWKGWRKWNWKEL